MKFNEKLLASKEKNFNFNEKTTTVPFLINQNKISYLEDYPVFIDDIYERDAPILAKSFFNKTNILTSSCTNCRSVEKLEYLCSCAICYTHKSVNIWHCVTKWYIWDK